MHTVLFLKLQIHFIKVYSKLDIKKFKNISLHLKKLLSENGIDV